MTNPNSPAIRISVLLRKYTLTEFFYLPSFFVGFIPLKTFLIIGFHLNREFLFINFRDFARVRLDRNNLKVIQI